MLRHVLDDVDPGVDQATETVAQGGHERWQPAFVHGGPVVQHGGCQELRVVGPPPAHQIESGCEVQAGATGRGVVRSLAGLVQALLAIALAQACRDDLFVLHAFVTGIVLDAQPVDDRCIATGAVLDPLDAAGTCATTMRAQDVVEDAAHRLGVEGLRQPGQLRIEGQGLAPHERRLHAEPSIDVTRAVDGAPSSLAPACVTARRRTPWASKRRCSHRPANLRPRRSHCVLRASRAWNQRS